MLIIVKIGGGKTKNWLKEKVALSLQSFRSE